MNASPFSPPKRIDSKHRFALGALLVAVALASPAEAQMAGTSMRVDAHTFFDADPYWLAGLRSGVGIDGATTELYPTLGVTFGYVPTSFFFIEGIIEGGLWSQGHLLVGGRAGLALEGEWVTASAITSPGLLWIPGTSEVGLSARWSLELAIHLGSGQSLLAYGGVDLLFDALGFDSDRQLFSTGIGWTIRF